MADAVVQVPPDSTGAKIDGSVLNDTSNALGNVFRQRVAIGDDNDPNAIAQVDTGGLHVEDDTLTALIMALLSRLPMPDVNDQLRAVLGTGSATIGAVNIAAAQTLATVTTLSTLTNMAQIGAVPANTTVFDMMNAATNQLYSSIQVT